MTTPAKPNYLRTLLLTCGFILIASYAEHQTKLSHLPDHIEAPVPLTAQQEQNLLDMAERGYLDVRPPQEHPNADERQRDADYQFCLRHNPRFMAQCMAHVRSDQEASAPIMRALQGWEERALRGGR
jgi:hypothetical protein